MKLQLSFLNPGYGEGGTVVACVQHEVYFCVALGFVTAFSIRDNMLSCESDMAPINMVLPWLSCICSWIR